MNMNMGLDKRFILHYSISLVICGVLLYLFFFFRQKNTVPVIDENPVTVSVPAGTQFYRDPSCAEKYELDKLPKTATVQILAMAADNHNLLVQTTDNNRRGWLKLDVFQEGVIPADHPFPGFYDSEGHRFSSSLKGFEGKRLEDLEKKYGTAVAVVPEKDGFVAHFQTELYNVEDHMTYTDLAFRFKDNLATEIILSEETAKKWSWSQYSPLFRLPIWLGYKVTPKQYKGTVTLQDPSYIKHINLWVKFESGLLQILCNVLLFFLYVAIALFVLIRLPLYALYPLPVYLKYSYKFSASTTNYLLALYFFLAYILVTPFIAMNLSTSSIWNLIWTLLVLGGGVYVFRKWSRDIEENKCIDCNRYKSYELTSHEFSHTTIEQRVETHTTNERRSGTVNGQSVLVDVPVKHVCAYTVEVKHYNDIYTCSFCGHEIHTESTTERRL